LIAGGQPRLLLESGVEPPHSLAARSPRHSSVRSLALYRTSNEIPFRGKIGRPSRFELIRSSCKLTNGLCVTKRRKSGLLIIKQRDGWREMMSIIAELF
jgi:hypothetical protein